MKNCFIALMAMLAMCGCTTVEDGDMAALPSFNDVNAHTAEWSSKILFDGRQLTVYTLPVTEWVNQARLGGNQRVVGGNAAVFTVTEAGYSSQTTVYRLQPDVRDTSGNAYGILVYVDDTPCWVAPVFGSDSELVVNHYTGVVTIALHVVSLRTNSLSYDVADGQAGAGASDHVVVNRVYVISGQMADGH